jgi:hypothetical protein
VSNTPSTRYKGDTLPHSKRLKTVEGFPVYYKDWQAEEWFSLPVFVDGMGKANDER